MNQDNLPLLRVGQGFDIHALVPGRPLILGGVTIAHRLGLLGHSDADALLHAVTDAILGAAGLGDIGTAYPDTDPQHEGANSSHLLSETVVRIRQIGYEIINIDATVIAQAPRLGPHIAAMCENLANACRISPDRVNIKAKTAERLGALGREEAISAQAVVLLVQMRNFSDDGLGNADP